MAPKRIVFIGAGSAVFTRNLVRDILTYPALADSTIRLVDINPEKLNVARHAVERILAAGGYGATVEALEDRTAALQGADAVVCTIQVGGERELRADLEIPRDYGVNLYIGDTRGPAGVFRFLRTAPVMEAIAADIALTAPDALFLNYTNPMAMVSGVLQRTTGVRTIGLCHSVQRTAHMLAGWVGVDPNELEYLAAGINHQAWYLKLAHRGEDVYPRLAKVLEDEKIWFTEPVRNDMYRNLGYYVTESSGHNSEYNPWYRKRPDLIAKYINTSTGEQPGVPFIVLKEMEPGANWRTTTFEEFLNGPVDLARGDEFASGILNAALGDGSPFEFNANVLNAGYIDNIPRESCVEVPIMASPAGFVPRAVGALPKHLAILNALNATCDDLAIEGYLEKDPEKIYQAIAFDPLTAAMLSLDEIRRMVQEMFAAADWLVGYGPLR
jgi:alpha-galactosidase